MSQFFSPNSAWFGAGSGTVTSAGAASDVGGAADGGGTGAEGAAGAPRDRATEPCLASNF